MDGSRNADEKASFRKKNSKSFPGRPRYKRDVESAQTSFEDFQDSVKDAWDIEDDEFWIKPEATISPKDALKILKQYKIMSETHLPNISTSCEISFDTSRYKSPVRSEALESSNINPSEGFISKLKALLSKYY